MFSQERLLKPPSLPSSIQSLQRRPFLLPHPPLNGRTPQEHAVRVLRRAAAAAAALSTATAAAAAAAAAGAARLVEQPRARGVGG